MIELFKKSYSGLSRETWLLGIVTLVNRSGMMVIPFLTLYLTTERHFTLAQSGIVAAFFGLGSMAGSLSGGFLSDRFGYFGVQLVSLILGGISCICLVWLKSFEALCIGLFITAALLDLLRPAMSSAISSFAGPDNLTRSFSLIRMAVNLGAGIGPAIAGILVGYSFSIIFIGDGITSIAAGVVLYFYFHLKIKSTRFTKKDKSLGTSPLKNPMFILFVFLCLCYAVTFFQLFCTLPLYYDHVHHIPKKEIGYLLALNGLIVFLFEMMLVYKIENVIHPKKVIVFGVLLGGIGLIMLNFVHSPIILIISMVALSFSEIFAMPFMMTVAVSSADESNRGAYTGLYSSAWSAAFILAPLIGTYIVDHFGFEILWWIMGGFSLIILLGMYFVVPVVFKKK
jgi:MFS family permease